MPNLKWSNLFKALFLAGFLSCLIVAFSGIIWFGLSILPLAWLFYEFRKKMVVFKRVFIEELPVGAKKIIPSLKKNLWYENEAKFYSCTIVPAVIVTIMSYLINLDDKFQIWILPTFSFLTFCFWLECLMICSMKLGFDDEKITDESIKRLFANLFKFILWRWWLFLSRIAILTIREVHSNKLVAVTTYSSSGMIYIIAFPPFEIAVTKIFLMAVGCGIFTGLSGLAIHGILSSSYVQSFFTKLEAWQITLWQTE